MVRSFFEEIFPYEKFPVEYECFKQLKDTNLNYIAIPWTQILNSHWLNYPNKQPKEFYFKALSKYKTELTNNFTVCQHDSYLVLENYYKHLNITKVFTPLRDKTERQIPGIKFIPIPFTNSFIFDITQKRNILFSFVGTSASHPIRERMRLRINGESVIYRDQYHVCTEMFFKDEVKKKEETEYQDILQRSKFSLCPRGSSCSSVRFWESLHAGSIPILISDNWLLPNWDWDNTIIQIKEQDFENMNYNDIKTMLENITDSRYNTLFTNCLKASKTFKQENFKEYIRSNI